MDRSTLGFLLFISVALYFGGVALGLSALPVLAMSVRSQPLTGGGIASLLTLAAVAYLSIRGFICVLLSIRWVTRNWKYSRREDLARRGLLVGWLPAFALPKEDRPNGQSFEYVELYATLIFAGAALGYEYSAGICSLMLEPGESCIADAAMLFGGPFTAMFVSYIFRWGPQPGPTEA